MIAGNEELFTVYEEDDMLPKKKKQKQHASVSNPANEEDLDGSLADFSRRKRNRKKQDIESSKKKTKYRVPRKSLDQILYEDVAAT